MKKCLLSLLLFSAIFLFAAPPETVNKVRLLIEQRTLVWKACNVKPLSETVKAPFAKDGWRIELQRPLESKKRSGIQGFINPGDPRNTMELVLLSGNPQIKTVRNQLVWLTEPGELVTRVVYLGKKWEYHFFIRGDIATISAVKNLLQPQGGDDLYPIYAEALNVSDFNDTSRKTAAQLLPAGGNKVIPYINRAIGIAIAREIDTSPHFVSLKGIGTPEAAAAIGTAIRSKIPAVVKNAEECLLHGPALKGAENLYLSLLSQRKGIDRALQALNELGCQQRALPIILKLKREPESFEQYMTLTFAEYRFRSGAQKIPELDLVEQVRILLARVGDIPGTPKFISVSDKKDNLEAELVSAERKRLQPIEREFAKSRNIENAVCSALMLCLFNPVSQGYNKAYIERVNAEGLVLLKSLPRRNVRAILRVLRDNVDDPKESEFFRKLMIQVG